MSIFINNQTKVIVQGITGSEGFRHTVRMLNARTNIVGGVNPRKAGEVLAAKTDRGTVNLPVFGTCQEAVAETGVSASVVFVPPAFVKSAVIEAVDAGLELVVVITEGIPVADSAYFNAYAKQHKARIIGPNCPGLVSFDAEGIGSNVGIIPDGLASFGPIGLVSKSGTLTYQMLGELSDIGFTSAIGIGGDPSIGTSPIDALAAYENDPDTKLILLVGEIGGNAEELAAEFIMNNVSKPVVAYIAGVSAPEGKTMGHAGAIISGGQGTAASKRAALEAAGVQVGDTPSEAAKLVKKLAISLPKE